LAVPASELRIANRTAYFRKAICSPDFESERVLARDVFQFGALWLARECKDALPFWEQARTYYDASKTLPAQSSPLTSYYCFLNATKALLTVKGVPFSDHHGVSGDFSASKRALKNEKISFKGGGVIAALSRYLQEPEKNTEHNLQQVLSNLPFIHRAYRYTYQSHPELFIPIRSVVYRKHPTADLIWVTADIEGKFADDRSLRTLPSEFERDAGYTDRCVVRTKNRVKWFKKGESKEDRRASFDRLSSYHRKVRHNLLFISAAPDLWYLKRSIANAHVIDRYSMTLIAAAMHRLSELSRYDPKGLSRYLEGKENWLLTEFIELAPSQFMDELVCEMTSLEFAFPGIRPRST
jgi:hypothetical protein